MSYYLCEQKSPANGTGVFKYAYGWAIQVNGKELDSTFPDSDSAIAFLIGYKKEHNL